MSSVGDSAALERALEGSDMSGLREWVGKHGKDAVVKIDERRPVIAHCAEFDFTEGVVWLVEQGADVQKKEKKDLTALHFARSAAVVEALLAAGAELEARNRNGATPLNRASWAGHNEAVAALIAAGADLNAADNYGWTPLMIASTNGHKRVVELLMAAGADTTHKHRGRTAEKWAIAHRHTEIAAIIRAGHAAARAALSPKPTAAAAAATARQAAMTALPSAAAAFDDAVATVVAERQAAVAAASLADVCLASDAAVQQLLLRDQQTLRADARVTAACDAALAAAAAARDAVAEEREKKEQLLQSAKTALLRDCRSHVSQQQQRLAAAVAAAEADNTAAQAHIADLQAQLATAKAKADDTVQALATAQAAAAAADAAAATLHDSDDAADALLSAARLLLRDDHGHDSGKREEEKADGGWTDTVAAVMAASSFLKSQLTAAVGAAAADDALRDAVAAADATAARVASEKAAWQRAGELTHRSRVLIAGDDCDTIVDGGVLHDAIQAASVAADEAKQAEEAVEAAHAALHKARDEAEGMAELAADGDDDAKAELAAAKAQVKRAKKAVAKAGIVAKKKARAVDAAPIALRSAHHALLSRCHEHIGGALSAATDSEADALCVLSAVHARWLQLLDDADKAAAEQAAADAAAAAAAASEEEGKTRDDDAADSGVGTVIGIYTLRSRLSVGRSMNTLWRATDSVGNAVVVKLLDDVSAFRRECNAIKTLHAAAPGAVVQLLHAEESVVVGGSSKHALVMPAGDWDMLAWCKGDHSEAERKGVLGRLALALAAVHGAGFVHGDVKPDNFVAFRSGSGMVWKLVDFGNAAAAGDACGREMTVAYAAPEIAEAADSGGALAASPSSDVWSFGMTVLTVLRRGRTLQGEAEDGAWLQALRSDAQLSLGSLGSGSTQRLLRGRCLRKAADDRDSMERICLSSFVRATSTATSVAAGGGGGSSAEEESGIAAVLLAGVKDALASSLAAAGEEQRALLNEALAAAEARRLAELGGLRSQLAEMAAAAESAGSATAEQLAEVAELVEALSE